MNDIKIYCSCNFSCYRAFETCNLSTHPSFHLHRRGIGSPRHSFFCNGKNYFYCNSFWCVDWITFYFFPIHYILPIYIKPSSPRLDDYRFATSLRLFFYLRPFYRKIFLEFLHDVNCSARCVDQKNIYNSRAMYIRFIGIYLCNLYYRYL